MTPFTETDSFDASVNSYDTSDPVQGGPTGVANNPLQSLVNRSRHLFNQIAFIILAIAKLAPLDTPAFTGSPSGPTPPVGDASGKLATMAALAQNEGQAVINCAGNGNLQLSQAQYGCQTLVFTGALTGNIVVLLPNGYSRVWTVRNLTTGAGYTLTLQIPGQGAVTVPQGKTLMVGSDGQAIVFFVGDGASQKGYATLPASGGTVSQVPVLFNPPYPAGTNLFITLTALDRVTAGGAGNAILFPAAVSVNGFTIEADSNTGTLPAAEQMCFTKTCLVQWKVETIP